MTVFCFGVPGLDPWFLAPYVADGILSIEAPTEVDALDWARCVLHGSVVCPLPDDSATGRGPAADEGFLFRSPQRIAAEAALMAGLPWGSPTMCVHLLDGGGVQLPAEAVGRTADGRAFLILAAREDAKLAEMQHTIQRYCCTAPCLRGAIPPGHRFVRAVTPADLAEPVLPVPARSRVPNIDDALPNRGEVGDWVASALINASVFAAGSTAIGMGVGLPALFVAVAAISWTSPDPWWFSLLWSVVTVMISVGAPRIARRAADGIALTGLRSDPKTSLDRSVRLHERLLDEVGALDDETRDNALNDPEVLQALSVAADLRSDAERHPSWETFTEYRQAARHAACIAERFDPRP